MRGRTRSWEGCVVFQARFEACAIAIPLSACPRVPSSFDGIIAERTRLWNAPQWAARSASVTLSDSHTQPRRFNRACSHLPLSLPHFISPCIFLSIRLILCFCIALSLSSSPTSLPSSLSLSLAVPSVIYVQAASILETFFLSCLTGERCGKQISDLRLSWLYWLLLHTADRLLSALSEWLCYCLFVSCLVGIRAFWRIGRYFHEGAYQISW